MPYPYLTNKIVSALRRPVMVLCFVCGIGAVPARAQVVEAQAPLMLAVSKTTLPQGVRALVVRTAGGTQMDIVVLAPDANSLHTLPGALTLLKRLRKDEPVARLTQVHYVELAEAKNGLPADRLARMNALLASARAGTVRQISGIGEVTVIATNLDQPSR